MALGQSQGGTAGFEVGADGDHAGDAGLNSPADDGVAVGIEVGEVEVAVSVNEHA
jgi:hypothetical protein